MASPLLPYQVQAPSLQDSLQFHSFHLTTCLCIPPYSLFPFISQFCTFFPSHILCLKWSTISHVSSTLPLAFQIPISLRSPTLIFSQLALVLIPNHYPYICPNLTAGSWAKTLSTYAFFSKAVNNLLCSLSNKDSLLPSQDPYPRENCYTAARKRARIKDNTIMELNPSS